MNRQEFFNASAVTWDERFRTQELLTFLERFVPKFHLRKGQRILDAGTGTGVLIPFLLKAIGPSGHVTAIDYAERMIEICRVKYAHHPNVSIAVQKVEKLDFPSESFDAVTCFGLFPHLERKQDALHEINRVLKPRGKLIVAHALSSAEIKSHHHCASEAVVHDVLPNDTEMRRLLKQAGFARVYIIDKPGCYLCLSYKSTVLK